jgi:acyl-CoA thioesterase-1
LAAAGLFLSAMLPAGGAKAEAYRIVGFGDSLMAGFELGPGEGFTDRLAAALQARGLEVEVVNAGVSGDTTSGGLSRIDWSVDESADLVILELGANDALRGIPPELTASNLDAMITRLKARDISVLLAGMLSPPNMGENYARAFNAIYPELAARHEVPLYPFFLDGVAAESDLLLADGMHPNARGVERIVAGILPRVIELMEGRNE